MDSKRKTTTGHGIGRRRFLKTVGAGAGAVLFAPAIRRAHAQSGQVTIRLQSTQQRSQEAYLAVARWRDEIEKRSKGKVKVQEFPLEAAPGGEKDALEGVRTLRVYDVVHLTTAILSTIEPRYGIGNLPFIFRDRPHAFKVMDGPIGQELDGMLVKTAGLRPLMRTYDLFRDVNLRSKAINTVGDFKGVKIRTIQSEIPLRTFQLLGANPVPMAFTEVYTAIQTGVLDGWEAPLDAIVALKMLEVTKYVSMTNHQFADVVLVMDETFHKGLPRDVQDVLAEVSHELLADHRNRMTAVLDKAKQDLVNARLVINEIDNKTPFQEAVAPIYRDFGQKYGVGDIIQRIRSA
jgi:tripartite ATP-independent transporter DctP family solute receptor